MPCVEQDDTKQRMLAALARPENARCADCDAPSPKWATITHGGFICTQCAGVHRSLGVHLSFVLSCTLDKWTDAQTHMVETVGNDALNELMEYSVPAEFAKPNADSGRLERERYIRAKYETELFKASPHRKKQQAVSSSSSSTNLSSSTSSASLVAATAAAGGALGSPAHHGMVEYIGVLLIELVAGAKLAGMDINGKSDPYVTFHLGEQSITSARVDNSVNPRWGQTLMLSWDGVAPLVADVFDYNKISSDRFMGRVIVDCENLAPLVSAPATAAMTAASPSATVDAWFQVLMPKEWATNFGEHMVAGAEGMGRGLYKGITGVWKDPIRGAKTNGFEGFAKGVGKGVAGIVYRPIKGIGSMVKQTALSVGVGKKHRDGGSCEELVEAGSLHLKLSLQRF